MKIQLDFNDICGIHILPIEENELSSLTEQNYGYKFNVFVLSNTSAALVPKGFDVYSFKDLAKLGLVDEQLEMLDDCDVMPFVAENWPHWQVLYNGTYHQNTVLLYNRTSEEPAVTINSSEQAVMFERQVRNAVATKAVKTEDIEKDL